MWCLLRCASARIEIPSTVGVTLTGRLIRRSANREGNRARFRPPNAASHLKSLSNLKVELFLMKGYASKEMICKARGGRAGGVYVVVLGRLGVGSTLAPKIPSVRRFNVRAFENISFWNLEEYIPTLSHPSPWTQWRVSNSQTLSPSL